MRGSTSIDQSAVTGESVPVDRTTGDDVYQGTINQEGVVDIEATSVGNDSSLRKMIRLVEEAEENKAPIVRIADKWARILVPVALGCTVLIYVLTKDIYRAVAALVVFCPCSLILATPTAMLATIGNATKKGILIKSGAAVEAVAKLDTLVMDKTGTLTYGQLRVEDVCVLDDGVSHEFLGTRRERGEVLRASVGQGRPGVRSESRHHGGGPGDIRDASRKRCRRNSARA